MLKSTAAIEEAKERGGSSVVNLFSIAGLTALATGMSIVEVFRESCSTNTVSTSSPHPVYQRLTAKPLE